MNIVIEMRNETKVKVPARRFFVSAAELVIACLNEKMLGGPHVLLRGIPKKLPIETSLVFISNTRMQRLNKKHRGKNKPTDVLSFPNFPASLSVRARSSRRPLWRIGRIVPTPDTDGVIRLGEVIIAPAVTKQEAALYRQTVLQHYAFLFAHGLLHLLGYNHETSKKDEIKMQRIQRRVVLNLK